MYSRGHFYGTVSKVMIKVSQAARLRDNFQISHASRPRDNIQIDQGWSPAVEGVICITLSSECHLDMMNCGLKCRGL